MCGGKYHEQGIPATSFCLWEKDNDDRNGSNVVKLTDSRVSDYSRKVEVRVRIHS
jgi:hypothetical protein